MGKQVQTIFKQHEKAVRRSLKKQQSVEVSRQDIHNATLNFINQQKPQVPEDSDDDFRDFSEADVEEAEDRIYKEYKKRKQAGNNQQLGEDEIEQLAGGVAITDMD